MELVGLCQELEKVFPLKFAGNYEPLSFVFPAVNKEAGINYRKLYNSQFMKYYNGLMVKGGKVVNKVFCTVFPDDAVLCHILDRCNSGDLIFTHHSCGFDDTKGFLAITQEKVKQLKDKQVSLYSLHIPFDINCPWSTSVQFAKAIGVTEEGDFARIMGKPFGIIGKPPVNDLHALAKIVGRETGAFNVSVIANRKNLTINRVAVIAGGGGYANIVNDAHRFECDTFITGTAIETVEIDVVREANLLFRQKAEELGINIIGGGHYHTEKIAVEKMVNFFTQLGLQSEFVPAEPSSGVC